MNPPPEADPRPTGQPGSRPNTFQGSVLTLLSGTTGAMAIAYLAQPVLTRLYPEAAFGLLDAFIALLSVLIPLASLRYEDALMLPERDGDAAAVWSLSTVLMLALTALTVGLLPWRGPLAAALGAPDLAPWLLLLPPTLLAMRGGRLAELWLTRQKRFKPISTGQMVRSLGRVSAQLVAARPPFMANAGGLIGGFLVGHAMAAVVIMGMAFKAHGRVLLSAFRFVQIREAAVRYRRFALYSTPSTLLNALLVHLPVLLLLYFFDATTVGYFGRTLLGLAVPMSLVGGAIAQVFFVHAAEARREDALAPLTAEVHGRLVWLALYPTLALLLAAPDVFAFIFGEPWRTSGHYMQVLAPWFALAGIASPLTRLFDVLERQRLDLILSLAMFTLQTAALVAGGMTGEVRTTLLLLGGAGVVGRLVHITALLSIGGVGLRTALKPYAEHLLLSLPGLLLIVAALPLQEPAWTTLAVVGGGLLYLGLSRWKGTI